MLTSQVTSHRVQFHETDAHVVASAREFLRTALVQGDAVIVIVTDTHRDAIEALLRADGIDIAGAREQGQYVAFDAQAILDAVAGDRRGEQHDRVARVLHDAIHRLAAAYPRTCVFGELADLAIAAGDHDLSRRVEDDCNRILASSPSISVLCAYRSVESAAVDRFTLARIHAAHSGVIPDGESPAGRSLEPLEVMHTLLDAAPRQPQSTRFFVDIAAGFGLSAEDVHSNLHLLEATGLARRSVHGWLAAR